MLISPKAYLTRNWFYLFDWLHLSSSFTVSKTWKTIIKLNFKENRVYNIVSCTIVGHKNWRGLNSKCSSRFHMKKTLLFAFSFFSLYQLDEVLNYRLAFASDDTFRVELNSLHLSRNNTDVNFYGFSIEITTSWQEWTNISHYSAQMILSVPQFARGSGAKINKLTILWLSAVSTD